MAEEMKEDEQSFLSVVSEDYLHLEQAATDELVELCFPDLQKKTFLRGPPSSPHPFPVNTHFRNVHLKGSKERVVVCIRKMPEFRLIFHV